MAESTISITSTYEHSPVVLMVNDTVIGTLGNFSASIGKAKSKKTFNVSAIVASALNNSTVLHYRSTFPENKRKILYIDTEQGRYHCQQVLKRILRLDEDGNINNDHNIHLRAQRATERAAKKRGWTTAVQIRYTNIHQVNRDCMDAPKSMPEWSWEEYKNALIRKGYSVHERKDAKNVLRGYALVQGNTKYKASELGVARNLMISKFPKTWDKLHHKPQVTAVSNQPKETQTEQIPKLSVSGNYTQCNTYHPGTVSYTFNHESQEHHFYIPEKVLECFNDEFDYRDTENSKELTDMAVAIFVGLFETPNVATGSGGGGSQSDLPWRDKDEDDLQWARICARVPVAGSERNQNQD